MLNKNDLTRVDLNHVDLSLWSVNEGTHDYLPLICEARKQGDVEAAHIWELLHHAAMPLVDQETRTFKHHWAGPESLPRFTAQGRLKTEDICDLVTLMPHVHHAGMRARIGDMAWHAAEGKDRKYALESAKAAVGDYLKYANDLIEHPSIFDMDIADALLQARDLALSAAKKDDALQGQVLDETLKVVRNAEIHPTNRLRLLEALSADQVNPEEMAQLSSTAARQAEEGDYPNHDPNFTPAAGVRAQPLPYIAGKLHDVAAKWHRLHGDEEQERQAKLNSIDVEVRRARAQAAKGNHMGSSFALMAAMRRRQQLLGAADESVTALHREARTQMEAARQGHTAHTEDITALVDQARPGVITLLQGKNLREALYVLSQLPSFRPETEVERLTTEDLNSSVLTKMFGRVELSADARVTSISDGQGDEQFSHWRAEFQNMIRQTYVHTTVNTAREFIREQHHPTVQEVADAIGGAPLIGPEDHTSVIRGIHAALIGDNLVASHLLVPRLETVFRRVLDQTDGRLASVVKSDGTEDVRMLKPMLETPEYRRRLNEYFGRDLMFEVETFFNSKPGPNTRNALCHGFAPDAFYQDWPGVIATHLLMQVYLTLPNQQRSAETPTDRDPVLEVPPAKQV